jgi:capsular polysaccharide biosynthesis protein
VNSKPEHEIIPEEEINLYDYWKVLVKRKKILIGIVLVPLVIVTIISLSLPRYYRGESELSIPALPASNIPSVRTAPNIVRLIGNIDDSEKVKIFTNNPDAIESVLISLPKTSTDKVNISIIAKTADIIPQAFKDLIDYINNFPGIKEEIARIQRETDLKTEKISEQTDFRIKNLIEARKANLIFLNDLSDVIKKRKSPFVNINPADLIRKDGDLSLEIMNLQQEKTAMMKAKELNVKINVGILGQLSITEQPSNSRIKQIIMITGLLSLFTGIFVIILLEYIDRMKAREK